MARRPTAIDVAKRAEVSRSAVSLILAGRAKEARLSEETEARVRQAAAELHYKPNASARSLVKGRSETVGLVIRDLSLLEVDPYLLPLLSGIIQRARLDGYRVLVESVSSDEMGDPFGELIDSGRIDGMIVENANYGDKSLRRLVKGGRPVVILGSQGIPEEWSVGIDDRRIGREMTRHLVESGKTRIAHISFAHFDIFAAEQRYKGYRETLEMEGLDAFRETYVLQANFSMESGYRAMKRLLAITPSPDAVFASSDAVAIGAMAAIHDEGLTIPDDIAVAGVDDIGGAAFCRPPLTTITSKPYETGAAAAEMLIDLMQGKSPAIRRRLLDTDLVVRQSTRRS